MKYIHYPINPAGTGLELVADVYIAKDFDIHAKVTPSEEFRTLVSGSKISEELRHVLDEVIPAGF
jgi:hypothetical protein